MSTDNIVRIGGTADPDLTSAGSSKADSTEFRRLLEQLEKLSARGNDGVVTDAEGLQDALRKAEDDFVAAMDLRRRLEEAFRRSQA